MEENSTLAQGSSIARHGLAVGFLAGVLVGGLGVAVWIGARAPSDSATPGHPPAGEGPAVATVDGVPITAASLTEEMARRALRVPGLFDDPAARQGLLEERIRFETIVARARAAGYERDPELSREWKRLLVRRYEADHLDSRIAELFVSDSETESYYEAHRTEYTRPERRRLALIFLEAPEGGSPARVEALAREAEDARAEILAHETPATRFAQLARQRSDERASRYVGGDVGWLAAGQSSYRWEPGVVEAMFRLSEPGAFSPVVAASDGYYLIRLTERETARPIPFEQIRPAIRHALLDEKRKQLSRDFYSELAGRTRVEIDVEAFEALRAPEAVVSATGVASPPRLPGG